jgi:phenylacetate-CoA ligase
VGTSLFNHAFPLLRYKSGDTAAWSGEQCPCGRSFPVLSDLHGRLEDYICTPEGNYVGRLDHIFKGVHNIVESQIEQLSKKELIIRIVTDRSFGPADEKSLVANARERLGPLMQIKIERVHAIPRTARGKLVAVIGLPSCQPDD